MYYSPMKSSKHSSVQGNHIHETMENKFIGRRNVGLSMNSWKVAIELDMNLNTTTPQG